MNILFQAWACCHSDMEVNVLGFWFYLLYIIWRKHHLKEGSQGGPEGPQNSPSVSFDAAVRELS